ncbi:MAG: peptide chain release factor N(5)-glutamine methyltransferase [Candidatus Omnitrophica bacterium]|nr:peptide chain release factor N(5)-glutamine methyltransferase [Candidatus Omnitrophota bacterium]
MEKRISLLNSGSRYLSQAGIENSLQEAEIFLSHTLSCPRFELYLDNLEVQKTKQEHFWQLLNARMQGLPVQYLLGSTEFMGLEFSIRPGVFVPRPETEILLEEVLKLSAFSLQPSAKVLDIGTGCGNIAISLAKFRGNYSIFACDISETALKLAKVNSFEHKTAVSFVKSDLFSAFKKRELFSLIISNPPYIKTNTIYSLSREVQHEPKCALDGGADGLFYYRKIIKDATDYLKKGGLLALEIGDGQSVAVREILDQSGDFCNISIVKDYNNLDRVVVAHRKALNG